jgi:post-segregation antitoxin (ccd killing protein)
MLACMARTAVTISDRLDTRSRHEAAQRGITISALVREAIEAHLGAPRRRLMAAGSGRSGRSDVSETYR